VRVRIGTPQGRPRCPTLGRRWGPVAAAEARPGSAPAVCESCGWTGGGTAAAAPDRRAAPRYVFEVPVTIATRTHKGTGTTRDVSLSGARIERADHVPAVGTRVRLRISFFADTPPADLAGKVVRLTGSGGFCVAFERGASRMRELLRVVVPKLAGMRQTAGQESVLTGELLVNLGRELQWDCLEAARLANMSLDAWVADHLRKAAQEELEQARLGPRPVTCPECSGPLAAGEPGSGAAAELDEGAGAALDEGAGTDDLDPDAEPEAPDHQA
jgi:hypothetical protein